jgi:hypothetical protein
MTPHWKDNFKNFAMEQLFITYSVLEVEEKLVEDEPAVRDNMEGGEDGMINIWEQGSWQRADIEERTKATMISLHDGRTSRILRWFIIFRA